MLGHLDKKFYGGGGGWVTLQFTLARSRMYIKRIEPKVPGVSSSPPPLWEQPPMCGQIIEFRLFEKSPFFHFSEPKKVIFCGFGGPKKLFLHSQIFFGPKIYGF